MDRSHPRPFSVSLSRERDDLDLSPQLSLRTVINSLHNDRSSRVRKRFMNSISLRSFNPLNETDSVIESTPRSDLHQSSPGSSLLPLRKRYLSRPNVEMPLNSPETLLSYSHLPNTGNSSRLSSLRSELSDKSQRTHVSATTETSTPPPPPPPLKQRRLVTLPTTSLKRREVTPPPPPKSAPRLARKAPFMQALEEIQEMPSITEDQQVIIDSYPKLMRCYDEHLREVYRAAEESCCRILANTNFPNLGGIDSKSIGSATSDDLTNAFFNAIDSLQDSSAGKRAQVPQTAAVKFKKWYDRYKRKPGEEALIGLCMETCVPIKLVSVRCTRLFADDLLTTFC